MQPIKTLIILLSFALITSCGGKKNNSADNALHVKSQVVKVDKLGYKDIAHNIDHTGTLLAYEELYLVPATAGRIEAINVDVGSVVNKGDVLVQMDKTQLHQAEIQLKNLEIEHKRMDTLKKIGGISSQKYDQFIVQYNIAKSNFDFLKENTRLVAPFSAVVSGKYYQSGEMFTPAPNTPSGKAAILSLVQINKLKALIAVSEQYYPAVKQGMKPELTSDLYPDADFNAIVSKIYPTIDPISRTFNIEITIDNSKWSLRPGMFVRCKLSLDKVKAFVLPASAILKMQGSNERFIFVNDNNKAKRVSVSIGERYNNYVEVISNALKQGDEVVVEGQARLNDGDNLEIR